MSQPFIGPLTDPQLPAQPTFQAFCLNWDAFDVPRLWDIVRLEDDELGWEQVTGFRHLSDLLVDHYRRLRAQHAALAQAWQSPAAEVVLARVGAYANAILSDGHCAATTANALHTIMATYADARVKMAPLISEWDNVTSDWKPEWWDHAADKLNNEARTIMVKTDAVVRDHRTKITIPEIALEKVDTGTPVNTGLGASGSGKVDSARTGSPVPPVPGHRPVNEYEQGAHLASAPTVVNAIPGQPISMLPIPPGSSYAPYGGLYVLPGPGVGQGGYVVPMPHRSNGFGRIPSMYSPLSGGFAVPGTATGAGAMTGMMPVPFGGQHASGQHGSILQRRHSNTAWPIGEGVPPVIEGIHDDAVIPNQPSEQQEEEFKEWFAELAYPWRSEPRMASEPHIILRKTA